MTPEPAGPALTVLYDGDCPLCRREIAFYRRRRGAARVRWLDVSRMPEGEVAPGLSRCAALARFHVLLPDGRRLSGGPAFAAVWRVLPAFRPLGWAFGFRATGWLADRAYVGFLRLRPWLQRRLAAPMAPDGAGLASSRRLSGWLTGALPALFHCVRRRAVRKGGARRPRRRVGRCRPAPGGRERRAAVPPRGPA